MDNRVLRQDLPVMVLFDENGTAQFVVMNACGNTVGGTKIPSTFSCNTLTKTKVAGQDNTYDFATVAPYSGLAKVVQAEYFVDGKSVKIETNPSTAVRLTFTKDSTVTVKVTFSLPGGQTRVMSSTECSKEVTVKQKVVMHVCSNLVATSTDNQTFRFTMYTNQDDGVTVKSADFNLDKTSTVTGVTAKDSDGNIFREYTFTDAAQHTVQIAKVTFVVDGKDVTVTVPASDCLASVTPKQTPPCTVNPNLPQCKTCVPTATQDKDCHELPHTGPAGTFGLFTGVSALGAVGHRLVMKRRARRSE